MQRIFPWDRTMFTGLVETMGCVRSIDADGPGKTLCIAEETVANAVAIGASVAVNGVCLTVVARDAGCLTFQAGPETLRLTNLGRLVGGERVNLERALKVGDPMGGHIVQGHVDGIGTIERREPQEDWETVWFSYPTELGRYMVPKGSIAVDGVSLTLVDVAVGKFSVALIPHTLSATTLGYKQPGATVNLEVDVLAKYIVKFLQQLDIGDFLKKTGKP